MDPSGEIEPVVLVPEPIPSAIHSMDAESEKEEMIDDIPHIPGDENESQGKLKNKFTSGFKKILAFGKSTDNKITNSDGEVNQRQSVDQQDPKSNKFTPGIESDADETNSPSSELVDGNVTNGTDPSPESGSPGKGPTTPQQDSDFTIISDGFNNKKSLANGLMDFAFLTANANQLHYALTARQFGVDRVISITLISASICLQIIAGILLITGSYIQAKPIPIIGSGGSNSTTSVSAYLQWRARTMNLIDHWTIALVFMIAIINIFIAAFATGTSKTSDTDPGPQPTS